MRLEGKGCWGVDSVAHYDQTPCMWISKKIAFKLHVGHRSVCNWKDLPLDTFSFPFYFEENETGNYGWTIWVGF